MRSGANDQERILETSLVQNGRFMKAREPRGQKELFRGCEEQLIMYYGVGGDKEK